MISYDDRLMKYDRTPQELRPALLEVYFDDREMRRMFQTIATDPVVRAILEFKELDVVPYLPLTNIQDAAMQLLVS